MLIGAPGKDGVRRHRRLAGRGSGRVPRADRDQEAQVTPRDVVAQALDYASWVKGLEITEISALYAEFSDGTDLATAFQERFVRRAGRARVEPVSPDRHRGRRAGRTPRNASPSTCCARRHPHQRALLPGVRARSSNEQLLSRAWLVDPSETPLAVPGPRVAELPWNGEYYVSYGNGRSWNDARRYGFICGGGGRFYSC